MVGLAGSPRSTQMNGELILAVSASGYLVALSKPLNCHAFIHS